MKNRNTVSDYLLRHQALDPISFHMPGHKGRTELFDRYGYGDFVRNTPGCDITEIYGADALTAPRTVIRHTMENYAELYGARYTDLLVNGSSCGLIASILATVPRGGKLILGRNSHKSVFSALRLGEIEPVYLQPGIFPGCELQGAVPVQEVRAALHAHPEASAVLITSPNYYGVLSDIRGIAEAVHAVGKILIVDQAHGAHLKFFDRFTEEPHAAENLGADIAVDSIHKTLLGYTGTAIVNVCSERVDIDGLADRIRMIQTTSPSYPMMGSLDINEKIIRKDGDRLISEWIDDLRYFYTNCADIDGLEVIRGENLDFSKINVTMRRMGVSGRRMDEYLRNRNIWTEMVHGGYVTLLTGIGNRRADYTAALDALGKLSREYGICGNAEPERDPMTSFDLEVRLVPDHMERKPLFQAEGCIAADCITPYPPGVPLVCPGEVLTYEVIRYLKQCIGRGETVLGIDEEGCVAVGAEPPETSGK